MQKAMPALMYLGLMNSQKKREKNKNVTSVHYCVNSKKVF